MVPFKLLMLPKRGKKVAHKPRSLKVVFGGRKGG